MFSKNSNTPSKSNAVTRSGGNSKKELTPSVITSDVNLLGNMATRKMLTGLGSSWTKASDDDIAQAIEHIPVGPYNVSVGERTTLPDKKQVYQTIEGLISHFEITMTNARLRWRRITSLAAAR